MHVKPSWAYLLQMAHFLIIPFPTTVLSNMLSRT